MKLKSFIIFTLLISVSYSYANPGSLVVDSMVKFEEAGGDCGCYFYMRDKPEKDGFILYWAFDDKQAVMKINGKITSLNIVEEKLSHELGQETFFKFKVDTLTVNGMCKVSGVCPPESESCEVTDYEGMLTVTDSPNQVALPVTGRCGC